MNGNIAYVSVGRAYGDTEHAFLYNGSIPGQLWSAESESASQSGAIWTWNLKLRIGIAPVSTKLYAKSPTGAALTYRVANTEEIKGKTYIKEDRLYYIPPASYAAEDQILIEVADSDGNTASYTVSISMDQ